MPTGKLPGNPLEKAMNLVMAEEPPAPRGAAAQPEPTAPSPAKGAEQEPAQPVAGKNQTTTEPQPPAGKTTTEPEPKPVLLDLGDGRTVAVSPEAYAKFARLGAAMGDEELVDESVRLRAFLNQNPNVAKALGRLIEQPNLAEALLGAAGGAEDPAELTAPAKNGGKSAESPMEARLARIENALATLARGTNGKTEDPLAQFRTEIDKRAGQFPALSNVPKGILHQAVENLVRSGMTPSAALMQIAAEAETVAVQKESEKIERAKTAKALRGMGSHPAAGVTTLTPRAPLTGKDLLSGKVRRQALESLE